MRVPGERVKRTRLIQTDRYVVAVEVELVIPAEDPSERRRRYSSCVRCARRAERGDVQWLKQHGKVYAATDAA